MMYGCRDENRKAQRLYLTIQYLFRLKPFCCLAFWNVKTKNKAKSQSMFLVKCVDAQAHAPWGRDANELPSRLLLSYCQSEWPLTKWLRLNTLRHIEWLRFSTYHRRVHPSVCVFCVSHIAKKIFSCTGAEWLLTYLLASDQTRSAERCKRPSSHTAVGFRVHFNTFAMLEIFEPNLHLRHF